MRVRAITSMKISGLPVDHLVPRTAMRVRHVGTRANTFRADDHIPIAGECRHGIARVGWME